MKDLNLIPKSYILEKKKKRQKIYIVMGIMASSFLLVVAVALPLGLRISLTYQRDSLKSDMLESGRYTATLKQLDLVKNLYKLREEESNKISGNSMEATKLWDLIEKSMPQKMFISNFSFTEGKNGSSGQVALNGISETQDEIATFVSLLRKEAVFESVTITAVKKFANSDTLASNPQVKGGTVKAPASESSGYTFIVNIYLKSREVIK